MFEQTFIESTGKTKKASAVASAFVVESILLIAVIVIPLMLTEGLPKGFMSDMLTAPSAPEKPKPPEAPPPETVKVKVPPKQFDMDKLMAPTKVPQKVAEIVDDPGVELPSASQVAGAMPTTAPLGNIMKAAPPPPPPPKAVEKPPTPSRIRVGGNVAAASLIRKIQPVYPQLAKQARVQGSVHFTAIIGKDGTIQNLQLIGGHPLLVQAAQDAVKQWLYKPTLLNGEPVEVVTQIDVNFTLSQ